MQRFHSRAQSIVQVNSDFLAPRAISARILSLLACLALVEAD